MLAGCGFSPIYASHDQGVLTAKALNQIYIDNIPDRAGQYLRNKLMDSLYFEGRPTAPDAILSVKIEIKETDLAIQKDATASRSQMRALASYKLKDKNGQVLLSRNAQAITAYSRIDAQYGLVVGQRDATERVLNEVAERIVMALSLYYAQKD